MAIIYIYDSTVTDFTYNGQPLNKAYEVVVDNIINDSFFVTFNHPLDDKGIYKTIEKDKIVKVHTPDGMQPFRVMDRVKYMDHVSIEAWPLFYADMRNKLVKPLSIRGLSGQAAVNTFVNNLLIDTPFTFTSNITDAHDYHTQGTEERENNPNQLYNALDVFKDIVTRWQGELVINGYDIRVVNRVGKNTGALLYEKKNISDFTDEESIQDVTTRLYGKSEWTERPEGSDEEVKHEISVKVESPLINAYSGIVFEKQYTNNDIRTEKEMRDWLNLKFTTENIDKPSRNIKVGTNIVDDTVIDLGDSLVLKYVKHDVDMEIRMVGYTYDGYANRYITIQLGDAKQTYIGNVQNTVKELETNVNSFVKQTVNQILNANGERMIYSVNEPVGNFKNGDVWFDQQGGMYFWDEEKGMWVDHPYNRNMHVMAEEVGKAISTSEEAKALAVSEAESALAQAKADATAKANAVQQQISGEVNTAISTAEDAKSLAVSEAEQALIDAKAHADAEVQASKEYFDGLIEATQSDVADAQATANSAVEKIDTAVANAGFTSLDETLQNMNNMTAGAEQNAQQAITDASNAYGLAQTSISEAQAAQANSLTALGKADNALDGVSNLDIRVDDVEDELKLKADNTFINEDGTLTTLSNAITFNANRFSTDMSRIESRVESLAGEINLVVLRGSIENRLLYGTEVFPNAPTYSASTNVMGELINVVGGETFALSKELTGADDRWRIVFYDENHNFISRFHPPANTQDIMDAPLNARYMWVSYPKDSKPQITRGTDFIPYRPNMADQMTTDEVVMFRNEYDEFADRTERRLTAIDSSDGRLATAELLITQTAGGLALKADQSTVDTLAGTVSSLGSDFDIVAGQVSSKVWKTDIDNIKIGGRNYFPVSKLTPKPAIGVDYPNDRVYHFNLEPETEYVLSTVTNLSAFRLKNGGDYYRVNFAETNDKGHKLTTDATGMISIGFWGNEVDKFINGESLFKIEKGNKATDWVPALEDNDAKIDHIETEWTQTFDTFSQTVSGIDGRVSAQKQTIDGLLGTVSGHDGRISTVEQTASG
ncbi:MAG TPA: hypothetical protein K8W25_08620, partial [Aerococcus urinaeequi]|nr:hypothetical protein [Aerococcus urinaeequi]